MPIKHSRVIADKKSSWHLDFLPANIAKTFVYTTLYLTC